MSVQARISRLGWICMVVLGSAVPVLAQTELEQARASLVGAEGFYLSVNMEGPAAVVEHDALDLPRLRERLAGRLEEAGLPLLQDAGVPPAERLPYLHVHVNIMQADRGQIPFSVEMRFFQEVHLARDPAHPVPAATWETSIVGLSYHNQIPFVADVTVELVDEFIGDFQQANL